MKPVHTSWCRSRPPHVYCHGDVVVFNNLLLQFRDPGVFTVVAWTPPVPVVSREERLGPPAEEFSVHVVEELRVGGQPCLFSGSE